VIRTRLGRRSIASALSITVAVAACSSGSDSESDQTIAATASPTTSVEQSDGKLTIGVMLPPAATLLRDPIQNGVNAAIHQVNAAGGLFGRHVPIEWAEEGDTAETGADAVQTLIDQHVDAIIGPASSTIAPSALTKIVSSGVLACSPTASALSLNDFPDDDLFFRTVPSDSMQAQAISQVADGTGFASVAIAYVDDGFGRPLSAAVTEALANVPIVVADSIPFASGEADQIGVDPVQRVKSSGARVLILLAGSNDGTQFLESLSEVAMPNLTSIIVNDALRSPESVQRLAALPAATRGMIEGVAPQAESNDPDTPFDPAGPFATQAFDCAMLIALAASIAESDTGASIAAVLPSVSTSGQPCDTFVTCSGAALEPRQIAYDGPSGLTDISSTGDPSRARFDVFSFDDTGQDTWEKTILVPT
jgi:branched-chain amino acid transport system substrate-binding protein